MLLHNIIDKWLLSQQFMLKVVHILAMLHRTNMVRPLHMVCRSKDPKLNLTFSLDQINLEKCLIKHLFHQLKHMAKMCHLNNHTHMHLVDQCSKTILHMVRYPLQMDTIIHRLPQHLLLVILNKLLSLLLGMVSLVDSSLLHMPKWDQQAVILINRHSRPTMNNLWPTMLTGIKRQQILLMVVPMLHLLMLHLLLDRWVMVNQLQHSLAMISPFLNQQLRTEVYPPHRPRLCIPSTMQPKHMVHIAEDIKIDLLELEGM